MRVCINTIDDRWDNRIVPLDAEWETFRDVILDGHVVADDKHAVSYSTPRNTRPSRPSRADRNAGSMTRRQIDGTPVD